MSHTPGEWESDGLRVWAYRKEGDALLPVYIASLKFHRDYEEAKANTDLIAAAPEMLAALEAVDAEGRHTPECSSWRGKRGPGPVGPCNCYLSDVRAAIKKAKGEV